MIDATPLPVEVTLVIPAVPGMISVARTAAASMVAEIDFSLDEIDNVRIAVNELVTLLIEAEPTDGRVSLVFDLDHHPDRGSSFVMEATISAGRHPVVVDHLTEQIVQAVTDDVTITDDRCTLRINRNS